MLRHDAELAIGMFRRSEMLDPGFVPTLTAWAMVLLHQATGLSRLPFEATMERGAEVIARRAVETAQNDADARRVLAMALIFRGDFTGAEPHLTRAQQINPGAPMTLRASGALLVFTGHGREGRGALRS
jgi:Flp pilus assembly protein TadD